MSISVRTYLLGDDGVVEKISPRVADGLIHGRDALSQYANSRRRLAIVAFDIEDGAPSRIAFIEGSFLTFDDSGQIRKGLMESSAKRMSLGPDRELRLDETVIDIGAKLKRAKLDRETRWEPTKEEIDTFVGDIWPEQSKASVRLRFVKSSVPRVPPQTYEGSKALDEVRQAIWKIDYALDGLTEPALKGLAHHARVELDDASDHSPIYRAVAEMADRRLEIKRRHRTGKGGTWYAIVRFMRVGNQPNTIEEACCFHEACSSKKLAVEAARRLAVKHAGLISETDSLETEILTDLEWTPEPDNSPSNR